MFGILSFLRRGSNDNEIGGADAVFEAILGHSDTEQRYTVTFGEPRLLERGNQYKNDHRVKVPTYTSDNAPEASTLEFPLPKGEDELLESDFAALLGEFDLDPLDGIKQLRGEQVEATLENGTLTFHGSSATLE